MVHRASAAGAARAASASAVAGARRRLARRLRQESVLAVRGDDATAARLELQLACFATLLMGLAADALAQYADLAAARPDRLRWPVAWAAGLPWREVVTAVTAAFVLAALAGLIGYRQRPARAGAFVALLLYAALYNSIGRTGHGYHLALLVAFFLALAPTLPRRPSRERTERALRLLLAAQAVAMLTYTLSGFWKVAAGVSAWSRGVPGLFSGRSLPLQVTARAFETAEDPALIDLIVAFPRLSSLLYIAAALLELGALPTVVWPRLAALWALGLAGLHTAIFWSMHIDFSRNAIVLVVLFGLSPFLVRGTDVDPLAARAAPEAPPRQA